MEMDIRHRQGGFDLAVAFHGAEAGVTALYGPSGAGKTSVVNMVAGLSHPDSGRIVINDVCVFDAARRINLPPEKRRIGYVFQDGRLLPHLSVQANLLYGMHRTPADRRFVRLDQVVDMLGIGHLLHRRPAGLSGGEKQRVAIGRALLTSPAMLLMDEPLASLDQARKKEVMPFILRLIREFSIPVLYVSHALDEILNLATHMVMLENGRVLASGGLEDLLCRADLHEHLGADESGAVISAVVHRQDAALGLTHLNFGPHTLKVMHVDAQPGDTVRVRIPARHVAVALTPPVHSSFQNIFPGHLLEIIDHGRPWVDLRIDIGRCLWARITRQSFLELGLAPGQPVVALVKSVSVSLGSVSENR